MGGEGKGGEGRGREGRGEEGGSSGCGLDNEKRGRQNASANVLL